MKVREFLFYLVNLVDQKQDKRLGIEVLLVRLVQDHITVFATTPKRAIRALEFVFSFVPIHLAAVIVEATFFNSSNSYLRLAGVNLFVDAWKRALFDDNERARVLLCLKSWDLLLELIEKDPIEKVRLTALQAIHNVGVCVWDQHKSSGKAGYEISKPGTGFDTQLSLLDVFPTKILCAVCLKCSDVSKVVQGCAASLLLHDAEQRAPDQRINLLRTIDRMEAQDKLKLGAIILLLGKSVKSREDAHHLKVWQVGDLASEVELPYLPQFLTPPCKKPLLPGLNKDQGCYASLEGAMCDVEDGSSSADEVDQAGLERDFNED